MPNAESKFVWSLKILKAPPVFFKYTKENTGLFSVENCMSGFKHKSLIDIPNCQSTMLVMI